MYKVFIKLLCLTPLLLLTILCNYFVDPAHLFQSGKYERGIAEILARGKNVANITNYDERLVQKYYIDTLRSTKNDIVIGSSRCMQLSSALIGSASFFNHGVSGAVLQDDVATYQMYRNKGLIPSRVFLSLDPWVLNKNNPRNRTQKNYYNKAELVASDHVDIHGFDSISGSSWEKYRQLLSIVYFQESLKKIRKSLKRGDYYPTENMEAEVPVKAADGSYSYDKPLRNRGILSVRKEAKDYATRKPVYALDDFTEIDTDALKKLDDFIKLLKGDHVKIVIILPPYHPTAYELLIKNPQYHCILLAESCFRQLGEKHHIKVLGSFDPMKAGLVEADFYDGMHPKSSGMKKILGGGL